MSDKYFHIYRSESGEGPYFGKGLFYVSDHPGVLSELAGIFAEHGINIIRFHYNRSEHPNRVQLEAKASEPGALRKVFEKASEKGFAGDHFEAPRFELRIMDIRNILNIEVRLQHRPGTLSAFSLLLAEHDANVIYMSYNEAISETSANFSIATDNMNEIEVMLRDINEHGYYCNPIYRGDGQNKVDDIIGLNLTERFFFHLKTLLNTDDIVRLRKLVESSGHLADLLLKFSHEAGKHFGAGDVTAKLLAFASASLMKTGESFSYRKLPTVQMDNLTLHIFRMPTGGNINILQEDETYVMIDGGYGLYYEDVKKMLRENSIDPGKIRRIYLTHADSDHAGLSGYFAKEFGSRVWLHAGAKDILARENRAWGSDTPLLELNHYFTVLGNAFTGFMVPDQWTAYGKKEMRKISGFPVIDSFVMERTTFYVLESLGGHVPGQVFFYNDHYGLFFSGDYLLLVDSLDPEERELLNIPKFMLTSTNVNSALFRREMDMLRKFVIDEGAFLRKRNRDVIIVPGHGDYYYSATLQ